MRIEKTIVHYRSNGCLPGSVFGPKRRVVAAGGRRPGTPQNNGESFVSDFEKAREADAQGRYLDAIAIYRHILGLNPTAAEAYSNLGLDYSA